MCLKVLYPLTARLFLRKICIEEKLITLDELNERISNFDYGYLETVSKPSIIRSQNLENLKQLLRCSILPLILGKCHYLENLLLLLEAMTAMFAVEVIVEYIIYLQTVLHLEYCNEEMACSD